MAASGGQRSPFGFEEAFKGGRCIQGGKIHSRREDAFKEGLGGIQEELMRTNKKSRIVLYYIDDILIKDLLNDFIFSFKYRRNDNWMNFKSCKRKHKHKLGKTRTNR